MVRETPRGLAFEGLVVENERVIASELFQAEIRNTFWKYVRSGLMTAEQAEARIASACALVDSFVPLEENAAESFAEAVRQDHSVYDLFYATLARRNAATVLTADKKFAELCEHMGIDCVCEVEL